jgi:hypothetical protein
VPILKNIAGAVVGEVIGHKRGHGLLGAGIGLVATRIATRSLPGALFVGGVYMVKMLYDKRREKSQDLGLKRDDIKPAP